MDFSSSCGLNCNEKMDSKKSVDVTTLPAFYIKTRVSFENMFDESAFFYALVEIKLAAFTKLIKSL